MFAEHWVPGPGKNQCERLYLLGLAMVHRYDIEYSNVIECIVNPFIAIIPVSF